eukprot:12255457-Alexandrium_andersonii.AAC.1
MSRGVPYSTVDVSFCVILGWPTMPRRAPQTCGRCAQDTLLRAWSPANCRLGLEPQAFELLG